MKRKIFLLTFAVLVLSICLSACQINPGSNGITGGKNDPEGFIYDGDSELWLIFSDMSLPQDIQVKLYDAFAAVMPTPPEFSTGTGEFNDHEIIVGESEREVSRLAYVELEKLEREYDEFGFVIYSDGASVAIAYDKDKDSVAALAAIDYFISKYVKESLTLEAGIAHKGVKTFDEYYREQDKIRQDAAWERLKEAVGDEQLGEEVVEAFKAMYTIYDQKVIEWFANLYSPRKCICENYDADGNKVCLLPKGPDGEYLCTGGGYYYSNSARDTVGYLPDAESTSQALGFWSSTGMADLTGGGYASAVPDWMANEIVAFIKSLQHSNGYFYHPQWGVALTDSKISRRARDLNWCTNILKSFGAKPIYNTPNGVEGAGDDMLVSYGVLTEQLGQSAVIAASKVVLAEDGESTTYAPHLQDATAFMEYLNSKDLANKSYPVGNELTAQSGQILTRDKQLAAEGKQTLMPLLIDWLNAGQNPVTGHWHGESNYYGVNGLLKISGIYTSAKSPMPYAEEAVRSAMDAIVSDEKMGAVVDIYNTWFAINNVTENLKTYGVERDGLSGPERAEKLINELLQMAPAGIKKSMEKIVIFRKDDGSFSYTPKASSSTSQGVPAAVPDTNEGDVNATVISIMGLMGNIYSALDLPKVPLFGEADRRYYVHLVENLGDIQKSEEEIVVDDPITFDEETVGNTNDSISDITITMNSDGAVTVIDDPREDKTGNIIRFDSNKGSTGDTVTIPNSINSNTAKCWVFEGSFLIESDGTSQSNGAYLTQITMGGGYMFSFRIKDGKVHIWEASSGTGSNSKDQELATVDFDEWFDIKVEYYQGTHSTVRIMFYLNGKLIAVTDNYLNSSGNKLLTGTGTPSGDYSSGTKIFVLKDPECSMLLDDLHSYKTTATYKPSADPDLVINVDSLDREQVTYRFDGDVVPEDITLNGDFAVSDGVLSATLTGSNSAELLIPVNKLKSTANCSVFTAKMTINSASNGNLFSLVFREKNSSASGVVRFDFQCYTEDGVQYMKLIPAPNAKHDGAVGGLIIPVGEEVIFKAEYYEAQRITVLYLNGEFLAASDKVYSGAHRFTVGEIQLVSLGGSKFDITLDDIRAERAELDFGAATRPKVDSDVQDFDTDMSEGVVTDGEVVERDGNKVLLLRDGTSLYVPINRRSNYSTVMLAEATFTVPANTQSGAKYRIAYVDANGTIIMAFDLLASSNTIGLYEAANDTTLGVSAKDFQLDKVSGQKFTLTFEYFPEKRTCNVYLLNICILSTSVYFTPEAASLECAGLNISASRGAVELDDVKCECYNKVFEVNKPVGSNPESTKPVINFEESSTGKLPTQITSSLTSTNAAIRIERMLNAYTGNMSNTLLFITSPGSNDSLRVGVTESTTEKVNSYVFEADIKIDRLASDVLYQFSFENNNSIRLNMIQFAYSGGKITLTDVSSNNYKDTTTGNTRYESKAVTIGNAGEWIHLRIEIYTVTGGLRTKVFVNGSETPIYVGDNYWGAHNGTAPNSEVTRVNFYTLSASSAYMYLDNVSLVKSSTEYDGAALTQSVIPAN